MATKKTAAAAARMFVETIFPMCNAASESPEGPGMLLYNADQMILTFVAGQQWLRDRCAMLIPLGNLTLEGGFAPLKDFLYSIPKGWSIGQVIEHLKSIENETE